MSNTEANQTTDPLPQLSTDEKLEKIQLTLNQLLSGQQHLFSELALLKSGQDSLKQDVRERYVDLRECAELNNDKLDVVWRELRQFIRDKRDPIFSS